MSDIKQIKIDGQLYDVADTQLRQDFSDKMEEVDEDIDNLEDAVEAIQNAGYRKIFLSTASPTSEQGSDGDVWLKYS